jgi:hypothetical protein
MGKVTPNIVHNKERRALKALIRIYGDDSNAILNGLHCMAVRVAIGSGASPENFTAGIKVHWDFIANAINEYASQTSHERAP